MNKGILCISIDTELLWGRLETDHNPFISRAQKTRRIIKQLLVLFEKYDIPATWAIVGSLYIPPNNKVKYSNLWHAPEIIKEIKKHKNQEIACHSYSHPNFDQITLKQAETEIKKCIELAKKQGIKLNSFVFPKNIIKHLDSLKKHGFTNYRGHDKRNWELLLPTPPPVYTPSKNNGLICIPGSMYFTSSRGTKKYIPGSLRVIKAKMGINKAIKESKVFHTWFHPIDLTDQPTKLLGALENILKYTTGKPILTISDSKGFGMTGVIINMFSEGGYIKYEINKRTLEKSGLIINSLLLNYAIIIKSDG